MTTTGYEGVDQEEKELPSPHTRDWKVDEVKIGSQTDGTVYGNIKLDGEVIGSIRMPSREYLSWFRGRLKEEV